MPGSHDCSLVNQDVLSLRGIQVLEVSQSPRPKTTSQNVGILFSIDFYKCCLESREFGIDQNGITNCLISVRPW